MEYTIQKLAELAGVTTRTLRWYHRIGLLTPSRIGEMQHSMQPDIPYQPLSSGNVNTGSGFNTTGRNNRPSCPLDQSNESRQVTAPNAERECLRNMPVAMAYTPIQRWNQVYDKERGLTRGTIFPELDLPFVMGRCR